MDPGVVGVFFLDVRRPHGGILGLFSRSGALDNGQTSHDEQITVLVISSLLFTGMSANMLN